MRSPLLVLSFLVFWTAFGCSAGREETGAASMLLGEGVSPSLAARSSIAPNPDYGRLRLRCEPPDAEVLVNGVTQGLASDFTAPSSMRLDAGLHRIEVRKEGFTTFRAEVVIAPEILETIPVTLQRLRSLGEDDPETNEGQGDEEEIQE